MWLTRLCIRYPVFASMLMLAFMVLGLYSWRALSVEEYPNVEFPYAVVVTDYPGASPAVVENEVTRRIEEAINTVPGVKRIISTSYEGRSRIAVEFVLGVPIDVAVQDVRDKLAAVRTAWSRDIREPLVQRYRPEDAPVFSLAFEGGAGSSRVLSTYITQQVVRRLQNIPGVGRVDVVGAMPREIQVELDPGRMEALGVGVDDVMTALRAENAELPAGTVDTGPSEKIVQVAGRISDPAAFGRLIVARRGTSPVTLDQVARIIDGEEELQSLALLNGHRAISLDIVKTAGANTIELVDALRKAVPDIEAGLPAGARVQVVADSSRSIRASLDDVETTLVEGAILAVLIVFLFLGSWRSTIITGLTLPISLLGSLFFLHLFGLTLNIMTLMALSLSIGLLIDDAIVVRENIVRHAAMGKSHGQAAVDGTREIGLAVLATTLTIVAVFLPVAFMGGIIGRFFFQFGVAVSCAVLLSMLVSFTLDPMLSSRWHDPDAHGMRGNSALARFLRRFQEGLDTLSREYRRVMLWALNNRRLTLGLAVASLALALLLTKFVGKEFVPEPDFSEISVKFTTPVGSTLAFTESKIRQVDALLRANPAVLNTYATVNTGMDIGKHRASLRVLLKPRDQRELSQKQLVRVFRDQLQAINGIAITSVAAAKESIGSLKPIQISLQGNDMTELTRLAGEFRQRMAAVPGVIDLESSLEGRRPTLAVTVDRERAADVGLSVSRIGNALRALIAGDAVTSWQAADGENYDVSVRLPKEYRQNARDVAQVPVAAAGVDPRTGQPLLLTVGQVATLEETDGAAQINRRNLFREVLFSANVSGRPAGDVGADIERAAAGMALPSGFRIVTQGANNDMKESVGYAVTALVLGALFIYMLLGAQFNSFLHPLTIMTALPLSLVGVFLGLAVCGSSMNMFSIIGILMLMGLVTKNAILLVDFIQELIHSGRSRDEAILEAGQTRLRPILMTTAAMIAGMLPLALGLGEGAEQRSPMAHALIGGLITSTALTLIVVPVMYTCVDDLMRAYPRLAYIVRTPYRWLNPVRPPVLPVADPRRS